MIVCFSLIAALMNYAASENSKFFTTLIAQLKSSYMTVEGGANLFSLCLPIEDVVIGCRIQR